MSQRSFEAIDWAFDEETGIGRITLDRPDSLNAVSDQMREDIVDGFEEFAVIDDEATGVAVRVVVIEGAGDKAFCAGADVDEFSEIRPGVFELADFHDAIEGFGAPVVAKIDGYCLGGGLEIALDCDFRVASDRSTFGSPEIDIGLIPGGGATQRLAELVGPARAKEIVMLGDRISAEEAESDGLLTAVYSEDQFEMEAESFVEDVADGPPLAMRAGKDVINMTQEMDLAAGRRYEHRAYLSLLETEDHEEGNTAFGEDREPQWQGR